MKTIESLQSRVGLALVVQKERQVELRHQSIRRFLRHGSLEGTSSLFDATGLVEDFPEPVRQVSSAGLLPELSRPFRRLVVATDDSQRVDPAPIDAGTDALVCEPGEGLRGILVIPAAEGLLGLVEALSGDRDR